MWIKFKTAYVAVLRHGKRTGGRKKPVIDSRGRVVAGRLVTEERKFRKGEKVEVDDLVCGEDSLGDRMVDIVLKEPAAVVWGIPQYMVEF